MARGAFKSTRGRKERKVAALVSRMPDRETFFETMTDLPDKDRHNLWFQFGKYVGQALPTPVSSEGEKR